MVIVQSASRLGASSRRDSATHKRSVAEAALAKDGDLTIAVLTGIVATGGVAGEVFLAADNNIPEDARIAGIVMAGIIGVAAIAISIAMIVDAVRARSAHSSAETMLRGFHPLRGDSPVGAVVFRSSLTGSRAAATLGCSTAHQGRSSTCFHNAPARTACPTVD